MTKLNLFSIFHLNLAFSSIEEEDRPKVIEQCYWPLLRLIENNQVPAGIELTGYTLEAINKLDKAWVAKFRDLLRSEHCELIGSGYSQIIAPLIPHEVHNANLKIGIEIYQDILGIKPDLALINEQSFSKGIVDSYIDHQFKAIIMEWENVAQFKNDWDPELRYFPQTIQDNQNRSIQLIWNQSIAFQKFQRYAQYGIELEEQLLFLRKHLGARNRTFALYGSDAEIFDYRPGRYQSEAILKDHKEWHRIEELYQALKSDPDFKLVKPSYTLIGTNLNPSKAITLTSAQDPIPVKKQQKYNITRWAVTGQNDFGINTRCWNIFTKLQQDNLLTDEYLRELSYLWSSDFRTHITKSRWEKFQERLTKFETDTETKFSLSTIPHESNPEERECDYQIEQQGRFLNIESERYLLKLNTHKGLAVHSFTDKDRGPQPLWGTLEHDYFDNSQWSADFYSGHLVMELPGQHKITDLTEIRPVIQRTESQVTIRGKLTCPVGNIEKSIVFCAQSGVVSFSYNIDWEKIPLGTLRVAHITLNPEVFDQGSLLYQCHNGGQKQEIFRIHSNKINHASPVSTLVSSSSGLGLTNGTLSIGDKKQTIEIRCPKSLAAYIGFIQYEKLKTKYFYRAILSAQEMDETSKPLSNKPFEFPNPLSFSVHPPQSST